MKLTIVRHGHSAGNAIGSLTGTDADPLTSMGKEQALEIGRQLSTRGAFDLVYSSPAKRALHTAALAGFAEPVALPSLRETDGGAWGGRSRVEFEAAFPDFFSPLDMDRPYPGGESHSAMARRVQVFLKDLMEARPDNAIVFTHLGPLNVMLHTLLEIDLSRFPLFALKNCAIVELSVKSDGRQSRAVRADF